MKSLITILILTLSLMAKAQMIFPGYAPSSSIIPTNSMVVSATLGTVRHDYGDPVGVTFTSNTNMVATALGSWCYSGNSQVHTLSIMSNCVAIATVNIDMSIAIPGQLNYVAITPTILIAGQAYSISCTETVLGDYFGDSASCVLSADFGNVSAFYVDNGGGCNNGNANEMYGPVGMLYTK